MSATYDAAVQNLNDAHTGDEFMPDTERQIAAQVGTGRAVLALTEETEVVAEQLRRLADVAEAVLLLLQPLADRAAAEGVLSSDVVEGAETRPGTREHTQREKATDVAACGAQPSMASGVACCILADRHDGMHMDGIGNTWSSCCDLVPGHEGDCGFRL